jgi:dolichol-phosphate mannosyltransferase
MPFLSIVSPVYNTGGILPALVARIGEAMADVTDDFEIILVDDGSPDGSWQQVVEECRKDRRVRGIKLSRNFGQHAALTAGLTDAAGDWMVVLDSDLQDPPREIPKLYLKAQSGYEIVMARRVNRKHSTFRRMVSRIFFFFITRWSGMPADHRASNFGIYSKRVISEVLRMKESVQFFPMMINWTGFRCGWIDVHHGERAEGVSGYNFTRLYRLALNVILSYSDKPLRYVVKAGLVMSFLSFLFGIITLIRYLRGDILVSGYTSLIISIWFLSGILLFTLGVVGLYVGKTFEEVKGRPRFIVEERTNQASGQ